MKKQKLMYGHKLINCPMCKAKSFDYCSYSEDCWGASMTVERHGICLRCGYIVEQAYSDVFEAFLDIERGFKKASGEYVPKNVKKHKRIRKHIGIKGYDVNPEWIKYI